jgi:hypothetical protein
VSQFDIVEQGDSGPGMQTSCSLQENPSIPQNVNAFCHFKKGGEYC